MSTSPLLSTEAILSVALSPTFAAASAAPANRVSPKKAVSRVMVLGIAGVSKAPAARARCACLNRRRTGGREAICPANYNNHAGADTTAVPAPRGSPAASCTGLLFGVHFLQTLL